MKNPNKQFEKNVSRLLKTGRESKMPSQEFTNTLIDGALNELESDQHRRQKRRKAIKLRKWPLVEIAAILLLCGGFICMVAINLGQKVESKFNSLSSEIEEPAESPEQPDLPEPLDFPEQEIIE